MKSKRNRNRLVFYLIGFFVVILPLFLFMSYYDTKQERIRELTKQRKELDSFEKGNQYLKKKDFSSAIKYYQLACKDSNKYAFYNVGMMYYYGQGVEKDLKKSLQYVKKGAELNDSVSQYWLSMCYLHGIGTDTNKVEYEYWINQSANSGYKEAIKHIN